MDNKLYNDKSVAELQQEIDSLYADLEKSWQNETLRRIHWLENMVWNRMQKKKK